MLNPSDWISEKQYPTVYHFIKYHLDMQINDVRTMLMLPLNQHGLIGGCNFAAAAVLLNIVSGISAKMYFPQGQRNSGERFKELLKTYFPWLESDTDKGAEDMYDFFRNGLAHALGIRESSKELTINKNPMSVNQINLLENETNDNTRKVTALIYGGSKLTLDIKELYLGVLILMKKLFTESTQMIKVEEKFKDELAPSPLSPPTRGGE